eukprot:7635280-Lingulodinium_polyedra.AAC.1
MGRGPGTESGAETPDSKLKRALQMEFGRAGVIFLTPQDVPVAVAAQDPQPWRPLRGTVGGA